MGTRILILILAALPLLAAEAEWPQFRGPESNPVGTGAGLPEKWSATENVEWSAAIPGLGWSSPIVAGGRVFLTTAVTDGASKSPQTGTDFSNEYAAQLAGQGLGEEEIVKRVMARDMELPEEVTLHYMLYCLDLATGGVVWKSEIYAGRPPGGRHRKNSFTSETPVTDGERVYVYVANLGLYAYDLDGNRVWAAPLEAYPIYLHFGTASSPALEGDQLIIVNDNEERQFIAAFDKRTGKELWRTPRDLSENGSLDRRSGWSTPFVWRNELRTEIVTIGPGIAVSYDTRGKELWRVSGMTIVPAPSPFAYAGLLYLDAGQTRALWAIRPGAAGDLTSGKDGKLSEHVAWSQARAGTYIPTPVAYEGGIYVLYDKGFFARFDASTGQMTYKDRIDREGAAFTSSPWAYNGKLFCISEEGKTYVIGAGDTFEVLHVNPLDEMALATPAIAGDRLLLRTATRIYSLKRMGDKQE